MTTVGQDEDQDLISLRLKLVVKDPLRRCLLSWLWKKIDPINIL
jgi:hypothetical protein